MKLIVDAQLPVKLCEVLREIGIDSMHVDELPNGDETPDAVITTYADENNLIVLTKDSDFYHSHMVAGKPQKLFLITTGNIKNNELYNLFKRNAVMILNALNKSSFIELSNEGVFEHH